MRLAPIALALVLFRPFPAPAAEPEWLKINSAYFEVFTTAGEKRGREILEHFEQVRDLFARMSASPSSPPLPVRIIAFRNDKEFKPYQPGAASAFYIGDGTRDYIVLSGTLREDYPMAVHEYIHLLIRYSGVELPVWLNEGLAEVNSTLTQQGDKVYVGHPIRSRAYALQAERWMPLEQLVGVTRNSPEYTTKAHAGIFYAQSWLLTHMLFFSDGYRGQVPKFLQILVSTQSAGAAFQQVYGKSLPQVQKDMSGYTRSTSLKMGMFESRLHKPAEQPTVGPAAPLETTLALADLQSLMKRLPEAEAMLNALSSDDQKRWEAQEALGQLQWRKGDRAAAMQHFERALTAGGESSWRLQRDYARLLQGEPAKAAQRRAAMQKTKELKPDLADIDFELGMAYYSAGEFGQAVVALKGVKKVKAIQAYPFFMALGSAQFRLGALAEAQEAAKRARQYAKTPQQIQEAERLSTALQTPPGSPQPAVESAPAQP